MRVCILIPTYNHGETLPDVLSKALAQHPVIVVDDGSTDGTDHLISADTQATVLRHDSNQGKGAALLTGFRHALSLGFTHAITIDADGQHAPDDIPALRHAAEHNPDAFIIGVRDVVAAGIPTERLTANNISNYWFHFETGLALKDTQCGFRCYPLAKTLSLRTRTCRYAYEFEILVGAAWLGYDLVSVPVQVDYSAPSSRRSHFRPIVDFLRFSQLHSRFCFQRICLPAAVRRWLFSAAGEGPNT
jgi:glycosyltransferase involved in cell wall biosynthesis